MAPGTFGLRGPRAIVRGTDLAGVVEAVGPGVTRWRSGDLVAKSGQLAAIPPDVPFEQAAVLPLAGTTALESLESAEPELGMSILVYGASERSPSSSLAPGACT